MDDLDAVLQQFQSKQYRKALIFVDNAGSDVVLGRSLHLLSRSACMLTH